MKGEISQLKKKKIKSYAKVSKIYGKDMTCLWTCEEGKWNFAGFTVVSQTLNIKATAHGKCLAKMEKTFYVYSKISR